jgi:hypothetical protein
MHSSAEIRTNSEELNREHGLSGISAKMGTLEVSLLFARFLFRIIKSLFQGQLNKKNRVAAHSHVKGLGLNQETGEALPQVSTCFIFIRSFFFCENIFWISAIVFAGKWIHRTMRSERGLWTHR